VTHSFLAGWEVHDRMWPASCYTSGDQKRCWWQLLRLVRVWRKRAGEVPRAHTAFATPACRVSNMWAHRARVACSFFACHQVMYWYSAGVSAPCSSRLCATRPSVPCALRWSNAWKYVSFDVISQARSICARASSCCLTSTVRLNPVWCCGVGSGCAIGKDGFTALAAALRHTPWLETLDVG
jgi:hypothetical protein